MRVLQEAALIISKLLPPEETQQKTPALKSAKLSEPVRVTFERFVTAVGRGTSKILNPPGFSLAYKGQVVKMLRPNNWTESDAELVGRWIDRQRWLEGVAPRVVAAKWQEWLAKAVLAPPRDAEVEQARELADWKPL